MYYDGSGVEASGERLDNWQPSSRDAQHYMRSHWHPSQDSGCLHGAEQTLQNPSSSSHPPALDVAKSSCVADQNHFVSSCQWPRGGQQLRLDRDGDSQEPIGQKPSEMEMRAAP